MAAKRIIISTKRVCQNAKFWHTLSSFVKESKMQGAEIEDKRSILKYMSKSGIEKQRSSLLIMTQLLFSNGKIRAHTRGKQRNRKRSVER